MDEKTSLGLEEPKSAPGEEKGNAIQFTEPSAVLKVGIAVHPQPTADPLDPLNWSFWKKHTIVAIVMFKYFMFTFLTSNTVPSFTELQETYNISYAQVNWTVAIPALGLSLGPIFWASFGDIYGRRISFIAGSVVSLASTIGAGGATSYGGYMAARFFQGLGVSPGAPVGLAIICDLFFDFERGQKFGLWVLAIDLGLVGGPLLGGYFTLLGADWVQWLTAIMFAVLLVLEILFLPETLYPRGHMLSNFPAVTGNTELGNLDRENTGLMEYDLARTKKLPFLNFKPIPGVKHPKIWDTLFRIVALFKFPAVYFCVVMYSFTFYWWILSIITMIPAAYVQYSPQIQGLLFIGLILGTLFAEALCSGRLSDFIVLRLAKRNNNVKTPEMRIWLAYPAALFTSIGLILWGISIDRGYHWIVGQIAFFLSAAGIQVANMVAATYVVDSYPLQSMAVITFYAVTLNLSAFVEPFFIAQWQADSGWTWCFAAQGIITFFASGLGFAVLHVMGPKWRKGSGEPSWINPEYTQ